MNAEDPTTPPHDRGRCGPADCPRSRATTGDEERSGHRPGRAARQGDADRQHDPAAARGGAGRPAGRGQPQAAEGDPPELHQGARGRPRAGAGRGAGAAVAAVHRRDDPPSEAELRIAQAQLVGWLEGLFHGIQTTLFAQQMAARAQLEQMRRALPGGCRTGARTVTAAPRRLRSPVPLVRRLFEHPGDAVVVVGRGHVIDRGQHAGCALATA